MDAVTDAWAALRLQIEWGADEALADAPLDRLRPPPPAAAPARVPPQPAAAPIRPAPPGGGTGGLATAETLDAWAAALRGFDGCALRATAMSTVLPAGDPAAPLLILGDAPDADSDRAGQAFAGVTGAYLDRMLGSIGLGRAGLRLMPLVPWRPPGGRPLTDSEVQACLPFLHRYLQLAPPRRLVLAGAAALRALAGPGDSLRRARGRWRDVTLPGLPHPVPALPTHPAETVRANPALRRDAWADLLTLRTALDGHTD